MRAELARRPLRAVQPDGKPARLLLHRKAPRAQAQPYALRAEEILDGERYVLVFAPDEPRTHLHHRDAAAEAADHLRELESYVAPADDEQVLRQEPDVHHRHVGQVRHGVEPRHRRNERPAADVDKDPVRREAVAVHLHRRRTAETRMSAKDLGAFQAGYPLLHVLARSRDDRVFACLDARHVDARPAVDAHPVLAGAPRQVRGIGARDHSLGRRAAVVHAGPAELSLLDHRYLHAGAGEARGESRARLASTDDERVEGSLRRHDRLPFPRFVVTSMHLTSTWRPGSVEPKRPRKLEACHKRVRSMRRDLRVSSAPDPRDGTPRRL
jgi:hypothetical protein